METTDLLDKGVWESALESLPEGYAEAAREQGALRRRRQVKSPGDLLRLAVAYAWDDLSLRMTAVWARLEGIGDLSSVAVLKRLRLASGWLGWLVMQMVTERTRGSCPLARPVRIVDATVLKEPGKRGTCWRLHLGLDLANDTISSLEFTGPEGGETFRRYTVKPRELLLGDRGYAHRAGVAHVLDSDGHALVRINWQNCPLEDAEGGKIDILALVRALGVGETLDFDVWFSWTGRRYKVRLLAQRLTAEPTAAHVRQAKRNAEKKGRQVDPRTLEASCFLLLLTDLSREELPADQAFGLYRLRWRVELVFKRLKSLLNLDHLRAHDPRLVTTYVMAKLLGAVLLEGVCAQVERALSPPPGEGAATRGGLADVEPVGGDARVPASAAGVSVPAADHGRHGGVDLWELPQSA